MRALTAVVAWSVHPRAQMFAAVSGDAMVEIAMLPEESGCVVTPLTQPSA